MSFYLSRFARRATEHPVHWAIVYLLGVILIAAGIFSLAEHESYLNGVWWGFVTATTVGYGDISPHTIGMRGVAVWVMFSGIATVAVFTATLAAKIVSVQIQGAAETQEISDDFDQAIALLQHIQKRYQEDENGDDAVCDAARKVIVAWRKPNHVGMFSQMDKAIHHLEKACDHSEVTDA